MQSSEVTEHGLIVTVAISLVAYDSTLDVLTLGRRHLLVVALAMVVASLEKLIFRQSTHKL